MLKRIGLGLLALVLLAPVANADSVVGSGTWVPFPAWPPGAVSGSPYWNQPSADGSNYNVGFFMTNTGAFSSGTAGPGALPYYANANGTAVTSFYFSNASSGATAALLVEVAGNAGINIFGWYDVTNPANFGVIFSGSAAAGATLPVTINAANYGFFLQSGTTGPIYYTQSSLNPAGDQNHQHFAVFAQNLGGGNPVFWIGIEDLPAGHSTLNREGRIGDYNDMIVRITPIATPVPEPATLGLMGAGLLGIAARYGRRRTV